MSELMSWINIEPDYRRFRIEYQGYYSALERQYKCTIWSVHKDGVTIRASVPKRYNYGTSIDSACKLAISQGIYE